MTITAPLPERKHRERLRAVSSAPTRRSATSFSYYEVISCQSYMLTVSPLRYRIAAASRLLAFPRRAVPGTLPPNAAASDLVGHRYGRLQRRPGGV